MPVRTNGWAPDGRWFGRAPSIVLIEGDEAQRLIPQIQAAVASYPYQVSGDYQAWPGPNSNTFVAHVMRSVPELSAPLPPTALGKDWQPFGILSASRRAGPRVQVWLGGYAGTFWWVGSKASRSISSALWRESTSAARLSSSRLGTDRNAADRLAKSRREHAKA